MRRPVQGRQLALAATIFAVVVALLGVGYFAFLRTDYVVAFSGLRAAEASAVVAELEAKSVPYRLQDQGGTILVPDGQADSVRLAMAGSDAPLKGQTGFELFNKSDMGVTEFAQKINYQRALQGELSRTITMMDGIDTARVHLAIPERSLFRGNRSMPKAAVTVIPVQGRLLDESRVYGIQRLVAATVPDLAIGDVVVLNELGRVVSQAALPEVALAPEIAERNAVADYYAARARAAVDRVLPGMNVNVRVLILPEPGQSPDPTAPSAPPPAGGTASPMVAPAPGETRNFRLRVQLVTQAALNPEDQTVAGNAVTDALKLDARDNLLFAVESQGAAVPATPTPAARLPGSDGTDAPAWTARRLNSDAWLIAAVAVIALGALALLLARTRRAALTPAEREEWTRRIQLQLSRRERADG
ncbi:flagellar basal-body MS-ring/collar protein FliF [Allosphingosinicella deserti]|nr:flagellar basal-body MS-ring/collar protein FliF [Sphingomonas deserti]